MRKSSSLAWSPSAACWATARARSASWFAAVTRGEPNSKRRKPTTAIPMMILSSHRLITRAASSFRLLKELAGEHGELLDTEGPGHAGEGHDAGQHRCDDACRQRQAPYVGDPNGDQGDDGGHDRGGDGHAGHDRPGALVGQTARAAAEVPAGDGRRREIGDGEAEGEA